MKLIHDDIVLGTITDVSGESFWMSGTLSMASSAPGSYREFFDFMTDENNNNVDPPFGPDLLDEDRWFIEQNDGSRRGIAIPAVYPDGLISWRWR